MHAEIENAQLSPHTGTPEALLASAIEARGEVDAGIATALDAAASFDYSVDLLLEAEAKARGVDKDGHPLLSTAAVSTIRRAYKALAGPSLEEQRETYLKETAKRITAQTMADKRRRLEAFGEWFGNDRYCSELDRKKAGQYVTGVILQRTQGSAGEALSVTTMKKEVSDLRAWFDWLLVRGAVEANPFDRMSSLLKVSTRGKAPTRRPWTA
ncbi:MAG: hypothetical protein ABIU96_14930, partial [Rhodanobacter sp.]